MKDAWLTILFITSTYLVLWLATKLFHKAKAFPILHPLITASAILMSALHLLEIDTQDYLTRTDLLVFLLGPATVALGVPLYNNIKELMAYKKQLFLPLLVGAILSPLTAIALLQGFEVDPKVLNSMVSKAITSPIAIDITKLLNGIPAIAVIFVLSSGIVGAASATSLFALLRIKHDISKGIAIGVSAHAIGTSRAIQISEQCAAFSVIAMCLNGIFTAMLVVAYQAI